jgi:hypothetical protein
MSVKPVVFIGKKQCLRVYEGHAMLDYDPYPASKEGGAQEYRRTVNADFCDGPDTPAPLYPFEDGLTGTGRDIGQMLFGKRPPAIEPELQKAWDDYKAKTGE